MKEKTIHEEKKYEFHKKWSQQSSSTEENLKNIVKILYRSPTGRKVIKEAKIRANEMGMTLIDILKEGDVSITDTTLIRKFSPSDPTEIVFETRSLVYIDRDLSLYNAILDAAHELTHFAKREFFNPYTLNFGLKEFVKSTIEGKGGEVEAYIVECNVMKELFPKNLKNGSNCQKVFDFNTYTFSKELGIQKFYRVGDYLSQFNSYGLGGEFTYLSSEEPTFISSAYGLPYPIAAIKEYQSIMSKVCRNDKKRIELLREQVSSTQRDTEFSKSYRTLQSLTHSFSKKCLND